jgi:hypothetical protein
MSVPRFALKVGVIAAGCGAVALWLPPVDTGTPAKVDFNSSLSGSVQTAPQPAVRTNSAEQGSIAASDTSIGGALDVASTTGVVPLAAQSRGQLRPTNAMERRELIMALQKELARVGCYGSSPSGTWTSGSKRAMAHFIESVNASLPADEPDYSLLSLVQHQKDPACQDRPSRTASLQQADSGRPELETEPYRLGADVRPAQPSATRPVRYFKPSYARDPYWRQRVFDNSR